jgi:hypothetical protein
MVSPSSSLGINSHVTLSVVEVDMRVEADMGSPRVT